MTGCLPFAVEKYAETPVFDEDTVPDKLKSDHDLKPGVWGRLCVMAGGLDYVVSEEPEHVQTIEAGGYVIIEPQQVHYVRPTGKVQFKVEFYR